MRLPGNLNRRDELGGLVGHQNDIGRLNRRIGAKTTHGHADVCARQHRRVVDPVSDKQQFPPGRKFLFQLLGDFHFLLRKQIRVKDLYTESVGRAFPGGAAVAGQHDGVDITAFQAADRPGAVGLQFIRNDEIPEESAVGGQKYDCAFLFRLGMGDLLAIEQRCLSGKDRSAVNFCADTLAGDFLVVGNAGSIRLFSIGFPNGKRNRVAGVELRMGGEIKKAVV